MISGKNTVRKSNTGVKKQKFAPKLPKIPNIPKYIAVIQILFKLSTYFCVFQRKFFGTMVSSKKLVIEPTAGVNEVKICPKIVLYCKYFYLQCINSNTIEFFNIFFPLMGKYV